MESFKILLLALVICFASVYAESESDVVTLTEDTFDSHVAENDYSLIEFYAPWCGHCKALAPEWEKAATAAKEQGINIKFAKVDCTVEKALGERFSIRGYPTIKFFKNGKEGEYNGPRQADGLIKFAKKKTSPPLPELDAEALEAFKAAEGTKFLVNLAEKDEASEDFKTLLDFASKDEDNSWAVVYGDLATDAPSVLMSRAWKNDELTFSTFPVDAAEFEKFAQKAFPLVPEIDQATWQRVFAQNKPIVIGVADSAEAEAQKEFLDMMNSVAEKFSSINFVHGPSSTLAQTVEGFGGSGKKFPTFIGIVPQGLEGSKLPSRWAWDEAKEINTESYEAWLATVEDGTLEPYKKSEAEPEDNNGPVKVVVGSTIDSLIENTKVLLLEFYAPWCGHCKNLAPIWEELGEAFVANDDVVIGKIDATANYVDSSYGITGFPTIILFKDGALAEKYSGGRTLEDLKSFVEKQIETVHDEL